MKKLVYLPLIVCGLSLLSGCATIVDGRYQNVKLTSNPSHANCSLYNNKGSWHVEETPQTVNVHRSMDPLVIACARQGYSRTVKRVPSRTKAMVAGNILFGGVLGGGIDAVDGAAFAYPGAINVDMKRAHRRKG